MNTLVARVKPANLLAARAAALPKDCIPVVAVWACPVTPLRLFETAAILVDALAGTVTFTGTDTPANWLLIWLTTVLRFFGACS